MPTTVDAATIGQASSIARLSAALSRGRACGKHHVWRHSGAARQGRKSHIREASASPRSRRSANAAPCCAARAEYDRIDERKAYGAPENAHEVEQPARVRDPPLRKMTKRDPRPRQETNIRAKPRTACGSTISAKTARGVSCVLIASPTQSMAKPHTASRRGLTRLFQPYRNRKVTVGELHQVDDRQGARASPMDEGGPRRH
jgi:hypothetical protein